MSLIFIFGSTDHDWGCSKKGPKMAKQDCQRGPSGPKVHFNAAVCAGDNYYYLRSSPKNY